MMENMGSKESITKKLFYTKPRCKKFDSEKAIGRSVTLPTKCFCLNYQNCNCLVVIIFNTTDKILACNDCVFRPN